MLFLIITNLFFKKELSSNKAERPVDLTLVTLYYFGKLALFLEDDAVQEIFKFVIELTNGTMQSKINHLTSNFITTEISLLNLCKILYSKIDTNSFKNYKYLINKNILKLEESINIQTS